MLHHRSSSGYGTMARSAAAERISQVFMKLSTVSRQMRIVLLRISDAGVQIQDSHPPERLLERAVQPAAEARMPRLRIKIDRHLAGPVIGLPHIQRPGIRIARHTAICQNDQIRILLHRVRHPPPEFLRRRTVTLKRDRRVPDIIVINLRKPRCVLQDRIPNQNLFHPIPRLSAFSASAYHMRQASAPALSLIRYDTISEESVRYTKIC